MKERINKILEKLKEFWEKIPPQMKKIAPIVGGGVLAVILIVIIFQSVQKQDMRVLYPKLSTEETTQVYSILQEIGITASINNQGEIVVPSDQWGEIQLQMAGRGYPKSAPTYDLFFNNSGFTRTEAEKRQTILYQTELRIRESLMQTKGIESASVNLAIPEETGYVWDSGTQESSASVVITMVQGKTLSSERVMAIKNLVAFSVQPQMNPDNVKVIDAATGIELLSGEDSVSTAQDQQRLEFQDMVEKRINDKVRQLLAPIYGADGVHVASTAILDFDKMLTEQVQYVPEDNGNGVKSHLKEEYSINGSVPMQSLVGEENNTDTPSYRNQTEDGANDVTHYSQSVDWQNSYIKSQIEKGQAVIKEATVSVIIKTENFDEQRRADLVNLVSKAVNIRPESISVQNYVLGDTVPVSSVGIVEALGGWSTILIIISALVLVLSVVLLVIILIHRRNKKRREEEAAFAAAQAEDLQAEIERHKKELMESAQANNKDTAITNEIRQFAEENPEITAVLIRSMLKEEE